MNLMILGAGGYGRTIADIARQLGRYETVAFLDDGAVSTAVLGKCEDYRSFSKENWEMYPAFGNNAARVNWLEKLHNAGFGIPALVHPAAYVSPSASLGTGVVVLPMAVVNTGCVLKDGCIVNIGALVDHDVILESCCHIAPGAIVKAENRIPAGSKIDSGTVVENRQYPL